MKEKELRRSQAVLPIGTVMKLTDLSARQIRYYEEQGLVVPPRSEGNRRMYSLNDIDKLLEIKDYLAEGINMAGIKEIYAQEAAKKAKLQEEAKNRVMTDAEMRRVLQKEFINVSGLGKPTTFPHNQHL
ncbi:MerR family transcriptional regulator [Ligilactobacillus equi]|uniref:Glutamine synthetase repressor n=2 Tax=Ligilactobacillus equi TaxID=137357 RepID=V7HXA5_9LACO|nr:MerR family transcriptional regulator [Ligilactobacillus equi]ETA74854.1 glutamine synthetase repressor [Ligilactobacillus equi DPC 6820]KRL85225.1 glutamine synthetase repressor [Ligilactobacillus equi DSM 15833 = JCM 10991]MCQ2556557.1 MerR family transcriptional regulator [Ligilactobacillus sp.]